MFFSVKNSVTALWWILLKSVTMSNQLFSVYQISQSKQANDMKFLTNTNKKPLLRPVTFFPHKHIAESSEAQNFLNGPHSPSYTGYGKLLMINATTP